MHNFWLAEILLALAAALVASQYWILARERCQSPALLIVAALLSLSLAAAVGAYRYGVDPGATQMHRALSRLSGYVTFPLIGLALLWARLRLPLGQAGRTPAYITVALVTASALGAAEMLAPQVAGGLYPALGLVLWLLVALWEIVFPRTLPRSLALLLAAGAALVIVAGLAIGTDATRLLGIPRINWFHLLIAAGALLLLCARPIFNLERKNRE